MKSVIQQMVRLAVSVCVVTVAVVGLAACSSAAEEPVSELPSSQPPTSSEATEPLSPEQLSAIGHPVVVIRGDGFLPQEREIPAGETIIWMNQDDVVHRVTIEPDGPESGDIEPDTWGQHKFEKPGTYNYHDPLYPELTGTIIVK